MATLFHRWDHWALREAMPQQEPPSERWYWGATTALQDAARGPRHQAGGALGPTSVGKPLPRPVHSCAASLTLLTRTCTRLRPP